jgi:hypothetical protein
MSLPWRGPFRTRVSMVPLLVCLKTSRFFVTQARWLSFSGLIVNIFVLHHERVISLLRSSVRSGPGANVLSSVWFGQHPTLTYFLATPLGKNLLRLYFVADSSCPSPTPRWSIFLSSPLMLHLAQEADRIWFWPLVISFSILQRIILLIKKFNKVVKL